MAQDILFPIGRLVGGSVYRAYKDTEDDGKTPKLGADGKQTETYSFQVAIEKGATTHWAQTPWGQMIWAEGHAGWGAPTAGHPTFAWKIKDGDDKQPGKPRNGKPTKAPAEREGWPGHWVISFSGKYAPKTCNADGSVTFTDTVERIKPGHFVQVKGTCAHNNPAKSAGVYMNYQVVAHSGFGPEIAMAGDVDAASVGFGGAPLPAGASAVPLGGMSPAQATHIGGAPAIPGAAVPGAPPAPPVGVPPSSALPLPASPPIVPNPAFLQPPVQVAPVPLPPPVAPAVPVRRMLPAANGATYEAMTAAGWTDALLVQHGMMA